MRDDIGLFLYWQMPGVLQSVKQCLTTERLISKSLGELLGLGVVDYDVGVDTQLLGELLPVLEHAVDQLLYSFLLGLCFLPLLLVHGRALDEVARIDRLNNILAALHLFINEYYYKN